MHSRGLFVAALAATISATTGSAASFDLATSFATKSSYWDQSKDPLADSVSPFAKEVSQKEAAKYKLVHVQNVVRHGTRFPTKGNTLEIQELLAKLQTNYLDNLPAWLQSYKLPYNVSVEGELAPAGTKETQAFGSRARKSIGGAVPEAYSADKFLVEHTYKPRTKDTAKAFLSTFFTNPADVVMVEHPKSSDLLFRFFDQCPRYASEIAENEAVLAEVTAFKASPSFQKQIDSLRVALNLTPSANITAMDVESAFSACAFDLAIYKTKDAWCTLLSEELIKACEYADDLDVFVENSAGAKISYEISAVLLRDVYKSFTGFTQQNSSLVGHFRFVHAETVLPLMTLLGYADKTPMYANASTKAIEKRKFRSSRLGPFMANLEFRLYTRAKAERCAGTSVHQRDCNRDDDSADSSDDPQEATQYFVQIRVNEQVTAVPGCDGKVFCRLSEIEKIWGYYLTEYDFAAACAV